MTSCTRESPIMHRDGQGEKGGTGCKRGTGGPIGGDQGEAGAGTVGRHRDATHSPPHPTGLPPDLLLGEAVNGEKYPVFKNIYKM